MNFETVKIGDGVHVSANGIVSAAFARECQGGGWAVLVPQIAYTPDTLEDALAMIAAALGDWYTATEAAERLVELGAFDKPPTTHDVCMWARNGLLPGAVKIKAAGQGGSWRIPASALTALVERRKGR